MSLICAPKSELVNNFYVGCNINCLIQLSCLINIETNETIQYYSRSMVLITPVPYLRYRSEAHEIEKDIRKTIIPTER